MHQINRHILWEPGDHPSVELLRQYHEDTLPPTLQHQLERHLLDCDLCSDALEGMALSDADKTAAAVKSINQEITAKTRQKKRRAVATWQVAAASLLLLCATVLVLYYNYGALKQEQQIATATTDKTIREAMKPAEEPVAVTPPAMADAAPDTVRPRILAAAPPQRRPKYTAPAVVPDRKTEISEEGAVQEDAKPEVLLEPVKLADAPAIARTTEATEAAKSLSYQSRTALAPESTSVERALAGKAAGVRLRGINSVAMKQVQGQVLSSDGQPLPGVAVTIKGTMQGVATDANGNFTISLPQDKATLAFNFIGFKREERSIDANTENLTVNLKEDTKSLSEVVVTGYAKSTAPPPVVVPARPAAGMRAYKKYLEENIRYTSEIQKGRVVVQATVAANGEPQNLWVVKSLCPACDQEAIRLIQQGPAWKPATSNGSTIAQQVKITVRFKP